MQFWITYQTQSAPFGLPVEEFNPLRRMVGFSYQTNKEKITHENLLLKGIVTLLHSWMPLPKSLSPSQLGVALSCDPLWPLTGWELYGMCDQDLLVWEALEFKVWSKPAERSEHLELTGGRRHIPWLLRGDLSQKLAFYPVVSPGLRETLCPVQCLSGVGKEAPSPSPVFMIENILPGPKRVFLWLVAEKGFEAH